MSSSSSPPSPPPPRDVIDISWMSDHPPRLSSPSASSSSLFTLVPSLSSSPTPLSSSSSLFSPLHPLPSYPYNYDSFLSTLSLLQSTANRIVRHIEQFGNTLPAVLFVSYIVIDIGMERGKNGKTMSNASSCHYRVCKALKCDFLSNEIKIMMKKWDKNIISKGKGKSRYGGEIVSASCNVMDALRMIDGNEKGNEIHEIIDVRLISAEKAFQTVEKFALQQKKYSQTERKEDNNNNNSSNNNIDIRDPHDHDHDTNNDNHHHHPTESNLNPSLSNASFCLLPCIEMSVQCDLNIINYFHEEKKGIGQTLRSQPHDNNNELEYELHNNEEDRQDDNNPSTSTISPSPSPSLRDSLLSSPYLSFPPFHITIPFLLFDTPSSFQQRVKLFVKREFGVEGEFIVAEMKGMGKYERINAENGEWGKNVLHAKMVQNTEDVSSSSLSPSLSPSSPSLSPYPSSSFRLLIQTLTGRLFPLLVFPNMLISQLKYLISLLPSLSAPPSSQRLFFSGEQLEDEETIAYYKLRHGSTINLLIRTNGKGLFWSSLGFWSSRNSPLTPSSSSSSSSSQNFIGCVDQNSFDSIGRLLYLSAHVNLNREEIKEMSPFDSMKWIGEYRNLIGILYANVIDKKIVGQSSSGYQWIAGDLFGYYSFRGEKDVMVPRRQKERGEGNGEGIDVNDGDDDNDDHRRHRLKTISSIPTVPLLSSVLSVSSLPPIPPQSSSFPSSSSRPIDIDNIHDDNDVFRNSAMRKKDSVRGMSDHDIDGEDALLRYEEPEDTSVSRKKRRGGEENTKDNDENTDDSDHEIKSHGNDNEFTEAEEHRNVRAKSSPSSSFRPRHVPLPPMYAFTPYAPSLSSASPSSYSPHRPLQSTKNPIRKMKTKTVISILDDRPITKMTSNEAIEIDD